MKKTSGLIKSRASKPKNHKWTNVERFSLGHGNSCLSLMSEKDAAEIKKLRSPQYAPQQSEIGVWRSESFGKTQEDLIFESARRLIEAGRADNVDDAVERATKAVQTSWHHQPGTETIVEAKEWRKKN